MEEMDKKAKIYFAGPDVFSPSWSEFKRLTNTRCRAAGFIPVFPTDTENWVSRRIVEDNLDRIRRADAVIANMEPFRGVEQDSGTCFEVGFAKALGKPVVSVMESPETMIERVSKSAWGPASRHESGWEWRDKDGNGIEGFGFPLNIMISETTKFATSFDEALNWLSGAFGKRGSWQDDSACEGLIEYGSAEAIAAEFADYLAASERKIPRHMEIALLDAAPKIFAATCTLRDSGEVRRDRGTFVWASRMDWVTDNIYQWGMRNLVKRKDIPESVRDGVWKVFTQSDFPATMRSFAEWWDRELLPNFVNPFVWGPSERMMLNEEEEMKNKFLESFSCEEYRDTPEKKDVFTVVINSRKYAPKFQFEADGSVSRTFALAVSMLGSRMSDWAKAQWMVSGNTWLGGSKPFECLNSIPDAVLVAAAKEAEPRF